MLVATIEILPVEGLPELRQGDVLADLVTDHIDLRDGDVVVVTQKVVSKVEGRLGSERRVNDRQTLAANHIINIGNA